MKAGIGALAGIEEMKADAFSAAGAFAQSVREMESGKRVTHSKGLAFSYAASILRIGACADAVANRRPNAGLKTGPDTGAPLWAS